MFSFGMLLFEILVGQIPFKDLAFNQDICRSVKKGRRPPFQDSHVQPDFRSMIALMEECWLGNPIDRPSAKLTRKKMESLSFVSLRQVLIIEVCFTVLFMLLFLSLLSDANF